MCWGCVVLHRWGTVWLRLTQVSNKDIKTVAHSNMSLCNCVQPLTVASLSLLHYIDNLPLHVEVGLHWIHTKSFLEPFASMAIEPCLVKSREKVTFIS